MDYINNNYQTYPNKTCRCYKEHMHVHEILGDVKIAEAKDPHGHRFASVTEEAVQYGTDHYHDIKFRTDFYGEHFHEFYGKTSGAIPVGDRHVHFLEAVTTFDDGHKHEFRAATLIDNPTGKEQRIC